MCDVINGRSFKIANLPSVTTSGLDQSCVVLVHFGDAAVGQDHGVLNDLKVSPNNALVTGPESYTILQQ